MITYEPLWKTMAQRGLTQYRLIKHYHFSSGQIGRLKKNMHVSTHTLDTLCGILGCSISDVCCYRPDEETASVPVLAAPEKPKKTEQTMATQEINPPTAKPDNAPAKEDKGDSDSLWRSAKADTAKGSHTKKQTKSKKSDKKSSKSVKKNKDGKKNKKADQ